jgi:outer membrane immunogenic protein
MKRFLLATTALAVLTGSTALAADMTPIYKAPHVTSVHDWTGFYIGGDLGGMWARKCWRFLGTDPDHGAIPNRDEGCHDGNGFVAGGQVGYNWQMNAWVFGVEAKWDWARVSAQNVDLLDPDTINRTTVNSVGLATARIGYAWDTAMIYVKGGAAWTRDTYDKLFIPGGGPFGAAFPPGGVYATTSSWRLGGAFGVGLEYALTRNWSVAFEYDYLWLGSRTERLQDVRAFAFLIGIDEKVQLATVRVNYHFGGGPVSARY